MLEMLSTCYTVVVIRQNTIALFSILISNFLLNVSFFPFHMISLLALMKQQPVCA